MKLAATSATVAAEFAGDVRPRVESRVGFQVAGRVTSRRVEMGQSVRTGDVLATLDPADLKLGAAAAEAGVNSATVDRDQQRADYARYTDLQKQGFISAADLERRSALLDAAEARLRQARAQADVSGNQAGYATLHAPVDGVVTAVEAEAGQVVAAGQSVVRIARRSAAAAGDQEVVVALPESRLAQLRAIPDVRVQIWALGRDRTFVGRVREIAPLADPGSRTFTARITLVDPPPELALGMTAVVSFVAPLPAPILTVPLQALYRDGDATSVWTVDAQAGTVRRAPVKVANVSGNDLVIGEGLVPGQLVVTAGVHLLKEGQKVKVLDEPSPPGAPAGAAPTPLPQSPRRS